MNIFFFYVVDWCWHIDDVHVFLFYFIYIYIYIDKLARNLNKDKLKLSELLANKYSPLPTFNGTWITDTSIAFIDVQGNFVRYDVEQNETEIVIDATIMVCFVFFQ